MTQPVRIGIWGSGGGSNAQAIIDHFAQHPLAQVVWLAGNRPAAGLQARAQAAGLPFTHLTPDVQNNPDALLALLQEHRIGLLALAGYLKKVPSGVVQRFPYPILNIHPALLPKFGGPGMYGLRVHEAVLKAGETHSGCTIHRVNEHYDKGEVLFQARLDVNPVWTPQDLQQAVLALEHLHYPRTIEAVIRGFSTLNP